MARNRWLQAFLVLALASCTGCCSFADRWCSHRYHGNNNNACCYPAQPVCCYPANAAPVGTNSGWNNPAPAPVQCPPCR